MNKQSNTTHLRREILVRIIKSYISENFEDAVDKIPYDMRPKNCEVPFRCCVHKERAILRERTIASLGFAVEDDNETTHLSEYAQKALERTDIENNVLTVIYTACKGCVPSRIYVTDLCQGCVARPCVGSCAFGAISVQNGKSSIDGSKCRNCTKCIQVCPYKAIAKISVPCEDSCPVGAIKKNESGQAEINFEKCFNCGRCTTACPFGAVHEKSQIVDILKAIKDKKNVIAMVAPSIVGQLPNSLSEIAGGLIKAGFSKVVEVARGADTTALNEAEDFAHRMKNGDDFMTTSCCAAYKQMVKKHAPELEPYVSETQTPLYYTAESTKDDFADCITVFISPCAAKKVEGMNNKNIDYVMSFEEIGALFVALRIELSECAGIAFEKDASAQGRNFGVTGGVANAVVVAAGNNSKIQPVCINGLDKAAIKQLKAYAKNGTCAEGNLVEVMSCTGGCVGGSGTLNNPKITTGQIKKYAEESKTLEQRNKMAH